MDNEVPKLTWGLVRSGKSVGCRVIVTSAESGGWDILLVPPPPAREVWNYWADDEKDLAGYFSIDVSQGDVQPWVSAGSLADVSWDGISPSADDFQRVGWKSGSL